MAGKDDVKALLFDVFGTVVDWRTSCIRELTAFGRGRGITNVDWTAFTDDWRGLYQPSMEEVRAGRRGFALLDDLHRESLRTLMQKYGLPHLSSHEVEHLVEDLVVLQGAPPGVGPHDAEQPPVLEPAADLLDGVLVVVGDRLAAAGLVARGAQRVQRQRVGRRHRALLLEQRPENALVHRVERLHDHGEDSTARGCASRPFGCPATLAGWSSWLRCGGGRS